MAQEEASLMKLNVNLVRALVGVIALCLRHIATLPTLYDEFRTDIDGIHRAVDQLISHVEQHLHGG